MIYRLVVLASGDGSTFEYLVESMREVSSVEVVGLIVDRSQSPGIERAHRLNIPSFIVEHNKFEDFSLWDIELSRAVQRLRPSLVVLAGFLKKLGPAYLQNFANITINTHPSLLPQYGGQGMYGRRVHEAVLRNRETKTGVTIHKVNSEYDQGQIIAQKEVQIVESETVESLEAKVKETEKGFLLETLLDLINKK